VQLVAYALAWLALTLGVALKLPFLMELDAAAREAVRMPVFVPPSLTLTNAGDPLVMLMLSLCLLGALVSWRDWERVRLVAGAIAGVALFRWGVLWLIERGRPSDAVTSALGWSYPSGHTAYSLTAALLIYLLVAPTLSKTWQHTALLAITVAWPMTVALTRVQLGVHWPIDVLAGWLLPLIIVPAVVSIANFEPHR
jgi:undecaprenyl-diphosphatase